MGSRRWLDCECVISTKTKDTQPHTGTRFHSVFCLQSSGFQNSKASRVLSGDPRSQGSLGGLGGWDHHFLPSPQPYFTPCPTLLANPSEGNLQFCFRLPTKVTLTQVPFGTRRGWSLEGSPASLLRNTFVQAPYGELELKLEGQSCRWSSQGQRALLGMEQKEVIPLILRPQCNQLLSR